MNKILLFLIILIIVLATSCTTQNSLTSDNKELINTNDINERNATEDASVLDIDDRIFLEKAITLGDKNLCEKLEEKSVIDDCILTINNKMNYETALSTLNFETCNEISDEITQKKCIAEIEVQISINEKNDKIKEEAIISSEIQETTDYSRCLKELSQPEVINVCAFNIISKLALENDDISLCEQIPDKKYQDECKSFF